MATKQTSDASRLSACTSWCFTLNNPETDSSIWDPEKMQYLIEGREMGEEGTPHIQGFVVMINRTRITGMRKILARAHWEKAHGTAKQASTYCKKEGLFVEHGEMPVEGKKKDQFPHKEVYEALKKKEITITEAIDENPEQISWFKQVQELLPPRELPARVLYMHSVTGLGKTTNTMKALKDLDRSYFKKQPGHKWFSGYKGEDVVIFEEFSSCFPLTMWLSLCDAEPPLMETKGGHTHIQAPIYIILSNLHPDEQYPTVKEEKPKQWDAYRRRLTEVHEFHAFQDNKEKVYEEIRDTVTKFVLLD